MRILAHILLLAALSAASGSVGVSAQYDEQLVKAAALINVARFVEWPEAESSQGPFVIAIASEGSFRGAVADLVRGRRVHDREVRVQTLAPGDGPCTCQVLFVGADEDEHVTALLESVRHLAVLTIGETPAFLRAGGVVRVFRANDRLRLQINSKRSVESSLRISSRLLRLAAGAQ